MVTTKTEVVERPWGNFSTVFSDYDTTVKILTINPHEALSLQYHEHRDEFWTLLDAGARPVLTINGQVLTMEAGVVYSVPRRVLHRISNPSWQTPVRILEVAKGHFDESDIVRVHDKYGR